MTKLYFTAFLLLLLGTSFAQAPIGSTYLDVPASVGYEGIISSLISQGFVIEYTSDYVIRTTFKEVYCHSNYTVDVQIYVNKYDDKYRVSARYKVGAEEQERESTKQESKKSWSNCAFIEIEKLQKKLGVGVWL